MKKLMIGLFVATSFMMTGCSDDDDNGNVIGDVGDEVTYNLTSTTDGSSAGTVTMEKNEDETVTITVDLENEFEADVQALHLHEKTAAETGATVLTLNNVDAETGVSTTTFSAFEDGTAASFQNLLTYDGYIDVHAGSENDFAAYADIGLNELTGESKTYTIEAQNGSEVEGTVTFEKRMDNTTLATVDLTNTVETEAYPVYLYKDNSIDGDVEMLALNAALGATGRSITQIEVLNDGLEFTFDDLLTYDGHIRTYEGVYSEENLIGLSDIGQNELTGNVETYPLTAEENSELTGTLSLKERMNGEAVAFLEMENTTAGINHAAFIYEGVAGTEIGVPMFTLNNVIGATGESKTNLSMLADGTAIDYEALLQLDGHVAVLNTTDVNSGVAAQGNIGANAQ